MFFGKFSDRALCSTWFGGLALILILPWSLARFSSIAEWSLGYAAFAIYLEGAIPLVMSALFGSLFGLGICNQESALSNYQSFVLGVKVSIVSALAWIVIGFLSILVSGLFVDTSRFAGGIVINAIFGFPVYGVLAGLGGIALRMLVTRRGITKVGSGQKTTK